MSDDELILVGVGDVLIGEEIPERKQPETIFQYTAEVLRSADITFAQSEGMFSDKAVVNPLVPHLTRSDPKLIEALKYAGFDIVSLAGNHTLDCGDNALLDSIDRLRKAGIGVIGVGANIAEATKPTILERKGTKVAFLGYCSTGPEYFAATERWPGFAPMRAWTHYEKIDYQPGTPPLILTFPNAEDLAALQENVAKTRAQADLLVLSMHWGVHLIPALIPDYESEIGHAAIDAGADLILGHHQHIVKGIEVYKGKVIFHGMGNFALVTPLPHSEDALRTAGFERTQALYKPYMDRDAMKLTFIAKIGISQKKIQRVAFLPCQINDNNEPELLMVEDPRWQKVADYLDKISQQAELDTKFRKEGSEVVVAI